MNKMLLLPALALVAGLAASPSFAGLKEDYMAACMSASGDNATLCTCKTEQAVKLADDEMLGYLIQALSSPAKFTEAVKAGKVPESVVKRWGFYVAKSNKVCIPPAN